MNADRRVARFLTPGGRPLSRVEPEKQLARFRAQWEERGFGIWALEERVTGRLVGRVGLNVHRLWPADPEVGWKLDPSVWGRGYATEAGEAAVSYGFERLGVPRVVSIVHPENAASIRVMDRLGIHPWREVWWPEGEVMLEVRAVERAEWPRLQSDA